MQSTPVRRSYFTRPGKLLFVGVFVTIGMIFLSGCEGPRTQSQAEAYLARAAVSLQEGEPTEAMAAVEKALALDPELLSAYHARAMIHRSQHDYAAALADLEKVISLDPDNLDAYIALGLTYQAMGDLEKTVASYQKAIELDPDNAAWYNNLCWAYGVFNQPEAGLEYCEQAVALSPEPFIHDSRGLVYALLGDYGNAIIDFTIYINYYDRRYPGNTLSTVMQRKAWIKTMQTGKNPFTTEVLNELRTQ
jgi:tetratricopeptide (TPR) repeat protein